MDKIKTVKIKNEDGSISEESYNIAANAINIDMNNGKNLEEVIGNIDIDEDGSIINQLNNLKNADNGINNSIKNINNELKKRVYFFNTIADMKSAKLEEGDMIITLGYYEPNDGGSAKYQVVSGSYSNDNGKYHFLNNNLYAKLIVENNTVNVKQFGARGDGIIDDSHALIKACECGKIIILGNKEKYLVKEPIVIYHGTTIEMNGSTITAQDTDTGNHLFHNFLPTDTYLNYNGNGNIIIRNGIVQKGSSDFIHGENILIENISFEDCRRDHYFEICACKNFTIQNCSFTGMNSGNPSRKEYINIDNCTYSNFPWFNQTSITYDGTIVDGVLIDNCVFNINNTTMQDAIGKHSYYNNSDYSLKKAENITIRNCKVYGATDCAFYFLGAKNVIIDNCYSENSQRLFNLDNCEYFKISGCISKNITLQNNINNSENIIICNNDTITSQNSFDVQLGGICNKITYSNNKFENKNGNRTPLAFSDSTTLTVTELNAFNNIFATLRIHSNLISIPQTANNISFGRIDHVNFGDAISNNIATNNIYDLTQFNRLVLEMGAISLGTYQEVIIKSFLDRNFQVGETFYFAYSRGINSPGVEVGSVTITDEHTLTSTGITMRHIICQNLPRQ